MKSPVLTIARNLANLVYPLHCASCGKGLDPLDRFGVCGFCRSEIRQNPRPYCGVCGRSLQNADRICPDCRKTMLRFEKAYSACLYEGTLKELIHLFKYRGKISLKFILSGLMIDFIKDNGEILDRIDLVTFVPIQRRRLRERDFNQSKVLASSIAGEFGLPLADLLEKRLATKSQNELSREERLSNLSGAFRMKSGGEVTGKSILLVDDVMTTGATLDECAGTLKRGGAREVRCLTLARGL